MRDRDWRLLHSHASIVGRLFNIGGYGGGSVASVWPPNKMCVEQTLETLRRTDTRMPT